MTAYRPASSAGWLDLDAAASERVATMLRALEEPGTLDALGIGSVRDAIANILSPGTSTIQTRLRYFIFLPWIFLSLEADRVGPDKFVGELRDREARLIDCLRDASGPNSGVIGYAAGRNLKRLPSAVYWGGLGNWGLRRLDLSLSEYGARAGIFGRNQLERDDDGNATSPSTYMWVTMPDPPKNFLDSGVDFNLRRSEANLLVDRIREKRPGSLLAALCDTPGVAADADFPWEAPTALLSEDLQTTLRHARAFSVLTLGPQHVYNLLLARHARSEFGWDTTDVEDFSAEGIQGWAGEIARDHEQLSEWADDLPSLWAFLDGRGNISEPTKAFLNDVLAQAVRDPLVFAEDEHVHRLIRQREARLKGRRARLSHRSALEAWNGARFGGQFDYRWPVTQGYLRDLAAAPERDT